MRKIIPCVCIEHKPDASDSVFYGMPQLVVYETDVGLTRWSASCPRCKRGSSFMEAKTSGAAIKEWNDIQRAVWDLECHSMWTEEFKDSCPDWRKEMFLELFE